MGLLPVVDCLPFYYASERGYFEKMGVDVRIITFNSQFDCDTALIGTSAVVGFCDIPRALSLHRRNNNLVVISGTQGYWQLISSKKLRLKKIRQLRLRTIATSRFSTSEYLVTEILRKANIKQNEALLPQVSDLNLRASMLDDDQVDAAILPEPFATQARMFGHNVVEDNQNLGFELGCLMANQNLPQIKHRDEYFIAILKAYNMAVDTLNAFGNKAKSFQTIVVNRWKMPKNLVDSINLPKYKHAQLPETKIIKSSVDYMKRNKQRILFDRDLTNDFYYRQAESE